jgi:hypothetical protein
MNKVTVEAEGEAEAIKACKDLHGWTPDAVREVDSGDDGVKAFMCFENQADAELWDRQV